MYNHWARGCACLFRLLVPMPNPKAYSSITATSFKLHIALPVWIALVVLVVVLCDERRWSLTNASIELMVAASWRRMWLEDSAGATLINTFSESSSQGCAGGWDALTRSGLPQPWAEGGLLWALFCQDRERTKWWFVQRHRAMARWCPPHP